MGEVSRLRCTDAVAVTLVGDHSADEQRQPRAGANVNGDVITRSRIAQRTERSEFIDAVLRKLAGVRVHVIHIHELRCR